VADFICNANIVSGAVLRVRAGRAECAIGALRFGLPCADGRSGEARFALRPEAIRLGPASAASPMVAEVKRAVYLGREVHYTLATPLGELFAVSHDLSTVYPQGSSAELGLHEYGVALIGVPARQAALAEARGAYA